MATYSDNFESYTDGNALSVASDWATATLSGSGVPTIDTHTDHKSGQVVDMSTTGVAVCVYQSAMAGADHWAEVEAFPDCGETELTAPALNGNGPVVRLQDSDPTTPDGYFARWTTENTVYSPAQFEMRLDLFKVESGSWTLLQSSSDLSGTYRVDGTIGQVPQTVRLTADGSSLSGEVEGVEVVTATDTTFASGSYVGAWHDRTVQGQRWQPFFDDFAAADLSAGSTPSEGSATDSYAFDDAVTGSRISSGSATDTFAFDDSVTGSRISSGSATDSYSFDDSVTGSRISFGSATDSYSFDDSVTGSRISFGSATDSYSFDDSVTGSRISSGSATDAFAFEDSVTGSQNSSGPFTDDFNRADSTDLGPDWTPVDGALEIVNGAVQATTSQYNYERLDAFSPTVDCYMEVVIGQNLNTSTRFLHMVLRADATWDNGYHLDVDPNSKIKIFRRINGSFTRIGAEVSISALSAGDTVRFQVIGTSLRGLINDVEVISRTDDNLTAEGSAHLGIYASSGTDDSSLTVDSVEVGSIGEPARTINVWEGLTQNYGATGQPQTTVDIAGNVSSDDTITSLTYSLNGGADVTLRLGPDTRRLRLAGDFIADIPTSSLVDGVNTVVFTLTTATGTNTETVTLNWTSGQTWALPTTVDWDTGSPGTDWWPVTGKWQVEGTGIRIVEPGYDRAIAVGDMTWDDYEVSFTFIAHSVNTGTGGEPLFGVLTRWNGHTDSPLSTTNPKSGWEPHGNIAMWQTDGVKYYAAYGNGTETALTLVPGTWHYRLQVEGVVHRHKIWADGDAEPGWMAEVTEDPDDSPNGSILLLAHHMDVTFQDVTVGSVSLPFGSATDSYAFDDSVTGSRISEGSATDSYSFDDSVTGSRISEGSATDSYSFEDSVTGSRISAGSATDSYAFDDSVTGSRISAGSATDAFAFDDSVTGSRISAGSATDAFAFDDSATGFAPSIGVPAGSVFDKFSFDDSVTGSRISEGSATDSYAFDDDASGFAPSIGVPSGSATDSYAFDDSVTGSRISEGLATDSYAFNDSASGTSPTLFTNRMKVGSVSVLPRVGTQPVLRAYRGTTLVYETS